MSAPHATRGTMSMMPSVLTALPTVWSVNMTQVSWCVENVARHMFVLMGNAKVSCYICVLPIYRFPFCYICFQISINAISKVQKCKCRLRPLQSVHPTAMNVAAPPNAPKANVPQDLQSTMLENVKVRDVLCCNI